jgi:hypothetical protein
MIEYERSDLVVVATVIATRAATIDTLGPLVLVDVVVSMPLKGAMSDTMTIVTGADGATCGYPFSLGTKYLIYADMDNIFSYGLGYAATSICSRTRPLIQAENEVRILVTTQIESMPWAEVKKANDPRPQ